MNSIEFNTIEDVMIKVEKVLKDMSAMWNPTIIDSCLTSLEATATEAVDVTCNILNIPAIKHITFYTDNYDVSSASYCLLKKTVAVNTAIFENLGRSILSSENKINEYLIKSVIHEIVHAKQDYQGSLAIDWTGRTTNSYYIWNGNKYNIFEYQKMIYLDQNLTDYMKYPWEEEAYRLQDELYTEVSTKMKNKVTVNVNTVNKIKYLFDV